MSKQFNMRGWLTNYCRAAPRGKAHINQVIFAHQT